MDRDWLDTNQRISHEWRHSQKELGHLRKIMAGCPTCRKKLVYASHLSPPEWTKAPEWEGWQWNPRTQSMIRWSKDRIFEIDEECGLTIDMMCSDRDASSLIEALDHETARKVAEVIAKADGGWRDGFKDEDDEARTPSGEEER